MTIKAILACDDYGGVSKKGTLPWPHNSTDLKWFKENTAGHVIVMGSTTWEDPGMPRPLPKRTNVIATTRPAEYPGANKYISGDLNKSVVRISEEHPDLITWIIGGPNIIEQTKKIESLFERTYIDDTNELVTFEIWSKRLPK